MKFNKCLIFISFLFSINFPAPAKGNPLEVHPGDGIPDQGDPAKPVNSPIYLQFRTPTIRPPRTTAPPTATQPPLPPPTATTTAAPPPPRIVVSGPVPVVVAPGTIVVGGVGGGYYIVNGGTPIRVPEGEAQIAGDKNPDDPDKPTTTTSSTTTTTKNPPQPTTECMVFPKENANDAELAAFKALFATEFPDGNFVNNELQRYGLQFITAFLTPDQINKFEGNKALVAGVVPDFVMDEDPYDPKPIPDGPQEQQRRRSSDDEDLDGDWAEPEPSRTHNNLQRRGIASQRPAPDELKVISQPPGTPLSEVDGYNYDESAGIDVTVYVLDTGYYPKSPSYTGMAKKPRWLYPEGAKDRTPGDHDKHGHGTCVGSKINSPKFGVAKNANLVIVKSGHDAIDNIQSLMVILDDVLAKGLQGSAILNWSRRFQDPSEPLKGFLRKYMGLLIKEDVIFVVAAGNDGENVPVSGWPQELSTELPIIVVGASDNAGRNATFSQGGPLVNAMAPGVDIECARNSFFSSSVESDGTSFAAPAVSGLIAYLLALGQYPQLYTKGQVAQKALELIQDMSYPRMDGGFPIIYNGQGASCEKAGQRLPKRFGGDCNRIITTTVAPKPTPAPDPPNPPPPPPPQPPLTPIYTFNGKAPSGGKQCNPVKGSVPSAGTYAFQFIIGSNDVIASIGDGATSSDPNFYQGKGSNNGTFFLDSSRDLSICTTNPGGGTTDVTWNVFPSDRIWDVAMVPEGATEVDKQEKSSAPGSKSCFPTASALEANKMYTFHYSMGAETILKVGDDTSEPNYYVAKGSGNPGLYGTLYMTSSQTINFCFENNGPTEDKVTFSIKV